ncbi:phenylacetate--CoA ligase family protein [Ornithinimicrobium pekingense]|nr:phenylacetate--CoA ligase family protein [Ornithinimicrobium pekingense]
MSLLRKVLRARRRLRARETWTAARLATFQRHQVTALRAFARTASPFYTDFHNGLDDAPLSGLPVLTKATLMEHFDDIVTDRDLHLADLQNFLDGMRPGELHRGRYYVATTGGTTGRPGVFAWDTHEWAGVLASYSRSYAWGGAPVSLTRRTRTAVVSSTTPWHQSALVATTVDSRFIPTLRLDAGEPLEDLTARLDVFQPQVLVGYASILRLLADAQAANRLHITATATFSASEVLTAATRRSIVHAWGHQPFDVYAATETAGIAAECEHHTGLHLFEDLVLTEVVDENYRAVPAGEFGAKILVTVLGSRTIPLIRYEMSDSVRLSTGGTCPCGMPFTRLDAVQGREQEALRLAGVGRTDVVVQPVVFHRVMDTVPVSAWQIIQTAEGLTILVASLGRGMTPAHVADRLQGELGRLGVAPPVITVREVGSIPRTAIGKAPLIRSTQSPRH